VLRGGLGELCRAGTHLGLPFPKTVGEKRVEDLGLRASWGVE
jgi:hypothetical protein